MHLVSLILIFVGAYHSLSRHFVEAVSGNCVSCFRPSTGNENTPDQPRVFRGPRAYAGKYAKYGIYCGAQNTQVQTSLNAALNIASQVLDDFWSPFHWRVRPARFGPLEQIFPTGEGFQSILLPLNLFVRGTSIRVRVQGALSGLSPRSVVCATPTMLNDYDIESSFYNVCTENPTIVAYHPAHSATVMLCPSFFNLPVHVRGRQCPAWNRFLQTFYTPYEPLTVEYQTYTLIRGFLDVSFGIEENIVVSPSPRVPNWNELVSYSLDEKKRTSALYQLYVALLDQQCRLSPQPPQNDLNQYIRSLAEYYLGKQNAQINAAVEEVVEEMINNVAGPSAYETKESSSGATE
ncbi:hypothetical protein MMC27_001400 [Xylographa pallens]|nr:hypothetical protein [Xylographa pallens]